MNDSDTSRATLDHLLLVDDDSVVRETMAAALDMDGFSVHTATSAEEAIAMMHGSAFDLVLLDLGLPGMSGLEALRRIRTNSDTPVIILTGAQELEDRLSGFDLGADDFVLKPAPPLEVGRRVRAVLRRTRETRRFGHLLFGPYGLVLDTASNTVRVGDAPLVLTDRQQQVLRMLLERRGEVVSVEDLSRTVWGYETFGERNFVEAQISRLRTQLAAAGARDVIQTVRGRGYLLRS